MSDEMSDTETELAIKEPQKALVDEARDDNNNESLIFESQGEEENIPIPPTQSSTADATKIDNTGNKIKRNKFKWKIHSTYNSLEEVEEFLESEGFVIYTDRDLKCGQKFYYRCMHVPKDRKREEWCARRYVLFFGKKRHISNEMRDFIEVLYRKETKKPSSVLFHIDAARNEQKIFTDEPNPTKRQLEYELKKFNLNDVGKMISLGDMMKWCEGKSNFPTNVDEAFVLAQEIITDKNKTGFRFSMSTPHLLEIL